MLRTFASSFKSNSRRFVSTSSRLNRSQVKTAASTPIPYITVSACAITSATIYYYLTNKVKNDDESKSGNVNGNEENSKKNDTLIEVIDIIDSKSNKIVEEIIEVVKPAELNENNDTVEFVEPVAEIEIITDGDNEVIKGEETIESVADEANDEKSGAFNEETGEINWDCPCLGGMAHGPCGEEFKAAFSCFVYSKEEPKGIECIDKFKNMQDCFRKYPDVYSEELRDDEELKNEVKAEIQATEQAVMNNDIIESVEEAVEEAKEIKENVKKLAFDLYGSAQKKIDEFNKK